MTLLVVVPVDKDEIIHHALQGVRGCLQGDQELTASNVTIAVVGIDQPFQIIEGAELQPYVRDWFIILPFCDDVADRLDSLLFDRLMPWRCPMSRRTMMAMLRWKNKGRERVAAF